MLLLNKSLQSRLKGQPVNEKKKNFSIHMSKRKGAEPTKKNIFVFSSHNILQENAQPEEKRCCIGRIFPARGLSRAKKREVKSGY